MPRCRCELKSLPALLRAPMRTPAGGSGARATYSRPCARSLRASRSAGTKKPWRRCRPRWAAAGARVLHCSGRRADGCGQEACPALRAACRGGAAMPACRLGRSKAQPQGWPTARPAAQAQTTRPCPALAGQGAVCAFPQGRLQAAHHAGALHPPPALPASGPGALLLASSSWARGQSSLLLSAGQRAWGAPCGPSPSKPPTCTRRPCRVQSLCAGDGAGVLRPFRRESARLLPGKWDAALSKHWREARAVCGACRHAAPAPRGPPASPAASVCLLPFGLP